MRTNYSSCNIYIYNNEALLQQHFESLLLQQRTTGITQLETKCQTEANCSKNDWQIHLEANIEEDLCEAL